MDEKQAAALRKPFPKTAVGILPKPYKRDSPKGKCGECGGFHGLPAVHLDYVGHAATTDRLLAVDPEWTWRHFTADEVMALPPKLRDEGLWIYLTVCGVTRPGVGDGSSAKECIGDAIRNAAMRFGVALDLWSKEELEGGHGEPARPAAPVAPQAERGWSDEPPDLHHPGDPMSAKTRGHLFALFGKKGIPEDQQLSGANHLNGTAHTSRSQITESEAKALIAVLKQRPDVDASDDTPVAQ